MGPHQQLGQPTVEPGAPLVGVAGVAAEGLVRHIEGDRIEIADVSSARGAYAFETQDFTLSLKTITTDRYWLDTGVFSVRPPYMGDEEEQQESRERGRGDGLVRELVEAVVAAVDTDKLEATLREKLVEGAQSAEEVAGRDAILEKLVLADILDESILGARPEDTSFPLRVLFGAISEHLGEDEGFALASGLSFYFRSEMDEEAKVHVGLAVSRLYYEFAAEHLEEGSAENVSPLLAKLMSTELSRLSFDAVDHMQVYDSSVHERSAGSDSSSAAITAPNTFACRVSSSEMVRFKAVVTT